MATVYHTIIGTEPICKNGSERLGVIAKCKFWVGNSSIQIDFQVYGETKAEAEAKMMKCLSNDGVDDVICVNTDVIQKGVNSDNLIAENLTLLDIAG